MSFSQKIISCQISLANGQFGDGGNSLDLTGLRLSCQINKPGGKAMGSMQMAVYGLPLSTMNQMTITGIQQNLIGQNKITVQAGDENGMSTVFQGFIDYAYMEAVAMPDVCFQIIAHAATLDAVKPQPSTSIKGSADVADIISGLASQMGYSFENNGVSVQLSNPYYSGSGYTQILEAAEHAGIEMVLDNGTVAIWPAGQSRQGAATLISPDTGMVGYPAFNQSGVIVTTLFNPDIEYGRQIQVESSLTPACGTWNITLIDYFLECMMPKGKWFQTIEATTVKV